MVLEDVQALQRLIQYMNFNSCKLQQVSFGMDYVEKKFDYGQKKHMLKPLMDKKCLKLNMVEKIVFEWS